MDEIIQIKCPFDGAVLTVKNQPGIETKNVTCPICKHKYPFTQFKRVIATPGNDDPDTEYPGQYPGERTRYSEDTEVNDNPNFNIGMLVHEGPGKRFRLKPGRNVIGRKAQKSQADIQIDTADKRAMSREHIVIEIKNEAKQGFVHYISLAKEKVNKTFVGGEQMYFGDCLILSDGVEIKLPDATLRFVIPDDEDTEL